MLIRDEQSYIMTSEDYLRPQSHGYDTMLTLKLRKKKLYVMFVYFNSVDAVYIYTKIVDLRDPYYA